jgi:hypothetical protein
VFTRALLLSYLHDCCQTIFFGLPPSYMPGEMTVRLPCEEQLWKAGSVEDWLSLLDAPSGSLQQSSCVRLAGLDLSTTFASMVNPHFLPSLNLSAFGHFVVIHTILRDLFAACSETITTDLLRDDDVPNRRIVTVQYALHNWLNSWTSSSAGHPHAAEEPPFFENREPLLLSRGSL